MRSEDIIRAWKDASFREGLDTEKYLPAHPAGMIELEDEDLEVVAGGDPFIISVFVSVSISVVVSEVLDDLLED